MGSSDSKGVQSKIRMGDEDEPLSILKHPRFRNARQEGTEFQEKNIFISVALNSKTDLQFWKQNAKKVEKCEIILMPVSSRFQKTQYCGNGGLCTLKFGDYRYLLSQQINTRTDLQGYNVYNQKQMWFLIYSLLKGVTFLHARNLKAGDVRPLNVFISDNGDVRLATQFTFPNEQTNFFKTSCQNETTYLAPEQLKQIKMGRTQQSEIIDVSQSFSTGLTFLDTALLSNNTQLYLPVYGFDFQQLDSRLKRLRSSHYSEQMQLLIHSLCQINPVNRITCAEAYDWLKQYQMDIFQANDFTFQGIPKKMQIIKNQFPISKGSERNSIKQLAGRNSVKSTEIRMQCPVDQGYDPYQPYDPYRQQKQLRPQFEAVTFSPTPVQMQRYRTSIPKQSMQVRPNYVVSEIPQYYHQPIVPQQQKQIVYISPPQSPRSSAQRLPIIIENMAIRQKTSYIPAPHTNLEQYVQSSRHSNPSQNIRISYNQMPQYKMNQPLEYNTSNMNNKEPVLSQTRMISESQYKRIMAQNNQKQEMQFRRSQQRASEQFKNIDSRHIVANDNDNEPIIYGQHAQRSIRTQQYRNPHFEGNQINKSQQYSNNGYSQYNNYPKEEQYRGRQQGYPNENVYQAQRYNKNGKYHTETEHSRENYYPDRVQNYYNANNDFNERKRMSQMKLQQIDRQLQNSQRLFPH